MAKKSTAVWAIEPHTQAKHDLLAGYLGAWFPILARYNSRVVFLDGFAGPGVYAGGEPGSPPIALQTLLGHHYFPGMSGTEFVFLFNEQDPERFASLVEVVDSFKATNAPWPANVTTHVENANFIDLATEILDSVGSGNLAPTFAFLDPFGYRDVPIELIGRLLRSKKSELFIYFDYNSANRFSTAGQVDPHFEALFGTPEFKSAPPAGDPARKTFLHDLYRRQLSLVCGFPYVQSFEMVNSTGRTGHYLFFCTRDLTGFDRMKGVMWKLAPHGTYKFSDFLAGQEVFLADEVDTAPLRAALLDRFNTGVTSIEQVQEFVVGNTPYLQSHIKLRTLKPMQEAGLVTSPNQRRKGQYPPGTLLDFRR